VVIVGAGLAGLTAATRLVRAGRSVVVLEASDRVGGRVFDLPLGAPNEVLETGAEFIGPTQDRIAGLASSLGVSTFPTYNEGDNLYFRNGQGLRYSTQGPLGPIPPDPLGVPDAAKALVLLNDMAAGVPVDGPQRAERAAEYDSQTMQTFIDDNTTTDSGRFLLTVAIKAIFSAEPRDLSLLFVLFYIAAAGNEGNPGMIERLVNTGGGAQETRFVGGPQQISKKLAAGLGKRVVLDAPVRRIVQEGGRVRVETDGLVATGQRVIVAIPPNLAGRIEYQPPLPAQRDQLTQRYPMGSVIKVLVVYPRAFWRDQGFSGQVVSDTPPVQVTFDSSPPDGEPGVLLGFIEASDARALDRSTSDERREAVIRNYTDYFGAEAAKPTRYVEQLWDAMPFSRGCPVCFTAPGVLLDYGDAIRRPVGRIHWAGTETSTFWNGYMDGAVRSGERVSAEVAAVLTRARVCATPAAPPPPRQRPRGRRRPARRRRRRAPRFTG